MQEVRSCGLCEVRRDLFSARKKLLQLLTARGAFEIPSLCGVGAAGTDQEMLQQQHQHLIILSGAKHHFVGIQNLRLPHCLGSGVLQPGAVSVLSGWFSSVLQLHSFTQFGHSPS